MRCSHLSQLTINSNISWTRGNNYLLASLYGSGHQQRGEANEILSATVHMARGIKLKSDYYFLRSRGDRLYQYSLVLMLKSIWFAALKEESMVNYVVIGHGMHMVCISGLISWLSLQSVGHSIVINLCSHTRARARVRVYRRMMHIQPL